MLMSKIACHCKKCGNVTRHMRLDDEEKGKVYCAVCGEQRFYAKAFGAGDFPELTHDENEDIHEARALGFAACFPAYPTAEAQALSTLKAAREWLETHRGQE